MLPKTLRFWLFDKLSLKTMRYVRAVPRHETSGLVADVYDMIADDFFINGSLTSRSTVPPLVAGIWIAGRESILVDDQLDRTTKEAMNAVLAQVNDCPYCGDMLISLVHAGQQHDAARHIFAESEADLEDPVLRERLEWVKSIATPGETAHPPSPFTPAQLPEAVAALMAMSDITRFSHVVMDGSPVTAPMGLQGVKAAALRAFSGELRVTHVKPLEPGRALPLLPPGALPDDMQWAAPNARIAEALGRWASVVEREADEVVPTAVRALVRTSLDEWQGELMPISRSWVEEEVADLAGRERAIARLALVLAKAPYQVDDRLVQDVLAHDPGVEGFVRILAWASFSAARRFARRAAEAANRAHHTTVAETRERARPTT